MQLLRDSVVGCAEPECARLASHVARDGERLVCRDHAGSRRLSITAARERLRSSLNR
jgi:hypothetical protein